MAVVMLGRGREEWEKLQWKRQGWKNRGLTEGGEGMDSAFYLLAGGEVDYSLCRRKSAQRLLPLEITTSATGITSIYPDRLCKKSCL